MAEIFVWVFFFFFFKQPSEIWPQRDFFFPDNAHLSIMMHAVINQQITYQRPRAQDVHVPFFFFMPVHDM